MFLSSFYDLYLANGIMIPSGLTVLINDDDLYAAMIQQPFGKLFVRYNYCKCYV